MEQEKLTPQRWQVTGTNPAGVESATIVAATTREGAIRLGVKQGLKVTGVVPLGGTTVPYAQPRDSEPVNDLVETNLFSVSGWAAFKFGFYASLGAIFVWVVVFAVLVLLASSSGLIAWLAGNR